MIDKKIIYSDGNLVVICNGKIYTKNNVGKLFLETIEKANSVEELELLMASEPATEEKVEKVTKEKWEEFVKQEFNKISNLNKDTKRYYLYEDSNGNYKLALDLLISNKSFIEKGNNVIGNLDVLYRERFQNLIKNRVKEIS